MRLWDFVHYTIGLHFYDLLTIIAAVLAAAATVGHKIRQKHREDQHEKRSDGK